MSLAKYFAKNRTPPTYLIGDRVSGKWNNIPFVGSVLLEHILTEENIPKVHVAVDLPIKYKGTYHNIVTLHPKQLKRRK
ncbi:MAG: hypothetical protein RL113_1053 [Pseudomonadota bacterium]|jgi:hypothetical protein